MESHKTFDKPVKKEKVAKSGVYRKYKKQSHIKKDLPKQKHIKKEIPPLERVYTGDPLLEPYRPGIAKVSPELHAAVMARAGKKCEICGGTSEKLEVHHVIDRTRIAHPANLAVLGEYCCHKPPKGVEGDPDKDYLLKSKYQQWCKNHGYSKEQTKFLMAEKLVSDWDTGERIAYRKEKINE